MSKPRHLFNSGRIVGLTLLALSAAALPGVFAEEAKAPVSSKRESGLYKDVFDQNIYYEGTQYLHLERLYRDLFGIRHRALNVNRFDEVPDSSFFTNRHGRQSLSGQDLKKGAFVKGPPGGNEKLTIYKGKFEGITPGFFIKDSNGGKFLLKFDPLDGMELATGAEIVASRFMHALGYNVPEYSIANIQKDQFEIEPGAKVYDESGFRKELTPERFEEFLIFVPQTEEGTYRASASRILEGKILGSMPFQGRRRDDPEDRINHEERREIRALQVFSAWLNNSDTRQSNSLDVLETEDGQTQVRHYLIDFNSTLGATPRGAKSPMFGHEHMIDYGETAKAFVTLGFWKKPWQKRWDEAGQETGEPGYGYFDNRYFEPDRFRTQLPYFPFKDLTRADGFWAAKILMKFSDEDVKDIVSTGEFSDPEIPKKLAETLIERRDLIARYWFKEANPLDEFDFSGEELRFEDLAVRYGFEADGQSVYRIDGIGKKGRRGVRLGREEVGASHFRVPSDWFQKYSSVDLLIRTRRPGQKDLSPFVRVELVSEGGTPRVAGVRHQD